MDTKHTHPHDRAVQNRISRVIGHMEAVGRMVEEGRDCSEVLIQLSAVRAQINNLSKLILKEHLDHCIVEAVRNRDEEAISRLHGAIDTLL